MNNIQLRREILKHLYKDYYREWDATLEEEELANKLHLPLVQVRGSLKYLLEKELVQTSRMQFGARFFTYVRITAKGIDLIEDESEFNRAFPPQIIYQYVAGNHLQVTVGDNATYVGGDLFKATIGDNVQVSQLAIGKDIVQIDVGANADLNQVREGFRQAVSGKLAVSGDDSFETQIARLERELAAKEPNLGEIQSVKRSLALLEGSPATATAALFSHPAVVEPIRRAVEQLIGHS